MLLLLHSAAKKRLDKPCRIVRHCRGDGTRWRYL